MTNDDKILKLLGGLTESVATVLEEQQTQRIAINHMHSDIVLVKADVTELKQDVSDLKEDVTVIKQTMATKADIGSKLKAHEKRLDNLEEETGFSDPTKH